MKRRDLTAAVARRDAAMADQRWQEAALLNRYLTTIRERDRLSADLHRAELRLSGITAELSTLGFEVCP